jgi:hypothetical protein
MLFLAAYFVILAAIFCVMSSPLFEVPFPAVRKQMTPTLEIVFAIGGALGFALGYGARAFISYRRHRAARQRYYSIL